MTTDQPEKFDLRSLDSANDKISELLRLFPEIRTEGGKLDFERLKLVLGETVDVGKERYGMNWPGKADCFKTILASSLGTLRPYPDESVNFDTTENLIIEGDNLEVLKLLQKSYLGKVKMIYIDPPYNTGNDFIYPDNFAESLQTYLQFTGQVDSEGRKFGTNTDTDGRFHSKWLNMMYPRLYLAKNLLREDGVILISIDDHEVENLRKICDEIFGEDNFAASFVWQKRYSRENREAVGDVHEYILLYENAQGLFKESRNLLRPTEEQLKVYKNPNDDPRGRWRPIPITAQAGHATPDQFYEIELPSGRRTRPPEGRCWSLSEATFNRMRKEGRIYFGKDGDSQPNVVRYLDEVAGFVPWTWWPHEEVGHTDEAKKEIRQFIGESALFDNPKPVRLIRRILEMVTSDDSIVMDFFAGSGTTAHAVMEVNNQDQGNRRFILVQLPEPTGRADYPNIADICKERVRRVIKKLNEDDLGTLDMSGGQKTDRGFRVFKLSESNFNAWEGRIANEPHILERQLELHVQHIRDGRESDDMLFELLLKSGFSLITPIEMKTLAGKCIYSVAGGVLVICLERELTLDLIRAIAALKPERVVCLDEGFAGNDQLKANAVQTFKTKGIVKFQTV